MLVTVEGELMRAPEARLYGAEGDSIVSFLILGKGLAVEARVMTGRGPVAMLAAEHLAAEHSKGSRVRACGETLRARLDHDVAAVLLLDRVSVTAI